MIVDGVGPLAFGIDHRLAANVWAISSQLEEVEGEPEIDAVAPSRGLSGFIDSSAADAGVGPRKLEQVWRVELVEPAPPAARTPQASRVQPAAAPPSSPANSNRRLRLVERPTDVVDRNGDPSGFDMACADPAWPAPAMSDPAMSEPAMSEPEEIDLRDRWATAAVAVAAASAPGSGPWEDLRWTAPPDPPSTSQFGTGPSAVGPLLGPARDVNAGLTSGPMARGGSPGQFADGPARLAETARFAAYAAAVDYERDDERQWGLWAGMAVTALVIIVVVTLAAIAGVLPRRGVDGISTSDPAGAGAAAAAQLGSEPLASEPTAGDPPVSIAPQGMPAAAAGAPPASSTTVLPASSTTVLPGLPVAGAAARDPASAATGCHPGYRPCLPDLAGDALDCSDLASTQKPVAVLNPGVDPYQLDDDDHDGVACDGS